MGFLGGSAVKNLPAMQETQVRSLGWQDPLEKGMATHSNILAWRVPGTKEPGGLQSMGLQSQTRLSDSHTHTTLASCGCPCPPAGTQLLNGLKWAFITIKTQISYPGSRGPSGSNPVHPAAFVTVSTAA